MSTDFLVVFVSFLEIDKKLNAHAYVAWLILFFSAAHFYSIVNYLDTVPRLGYTYTIRITLYTMAALYFYLDIKG